MILHSLCRYYERAGRDGTRSFAPYGYSESPAAFVVMLDPSGRVVNIVSLNSSDGGKKPGVVLQTPSLGKARTNGIEANFLWDNPGYVFGADAKDKPQRALKTHANFVDLHERILGGAEDPGLKAVLMFVRSWRPENAPALPLWEEIMNAAGNNLVFKLDGGDSYVHDSAEAKQLWSAYLGADENDEDDSPASGRCLVTGKTVAVAKLHPQIKGVYDAQPTGAGLCTFNMASAESFGKDQNHNAPVGKYAAFAYAAALNSLLADDKRRLTLGDSTMVVWADAPSPAEECIARLFSPLDDDAGDNREVDDKTAKRVWDILKKLVRGQNAEGEIEELNPDAVFHLLCLAPNSARLAVRFHVADTLRRFLELSARHYSRLRIVRRSEKEPPFISPRLIVRELAGKYKKAKEIQRLAGDLVRAVVTGGRYPQYFLALAIDRIRAERDVSYVKAAMLKALFIRNYLKEIPMTQDQDLPDIPYQLGRLFSLLGRVQYEALDKVNANIRDKFYGAASSIPASIFPLLIKNAQNHLAKIRKDKGESRAKMFDALIGDALSHINSFPKYTTLEQQGMFAIGYYQQRHGWKKDLLPDDDDTEKDDAE